MQSSDSPVNMALFIDVENLIGGASSLGIPVDLAPVVQKLKEQGRILIRRSYGDIKNCLLHVGRPKMEDAIRRMLLKNLVQIEDIPFMTANKNTADMRLVVDALSEAFTNDAISHFVVLSSDRDYIPLYNKLHELNKTVIAIVIDRLNVNSMVIEAVDKVEYYETLVAGEEPQGKVAPAQEESLARGETTSLLREYFRTLQNAVRTLENRQQAAVGARVAPMMQQLRSDFDPANVGLKSLKEFVRLAEAEHIVRVDWADGKSDFTLSIGSTVMPGVGAALPPAQAATGDTKKIAKAYRKFLEDKLKVPLPSYEQRRTIYQNAEAARQRMAKEGPFLLVEWKDEILAKSVPRLDEKTVYKVLLSLQYARCFYCEPGGQPTNPVIVGLKVDPERWDSAILANFCRQMINEASWGQLDAPALAELFFTNDPDGAQKVDAILSAMRE